MDTDVKQVVGVFRNGQVEIDGALDWPEGVTVVVRIDPEATKWNSDDRPRTPEEIDAHLKRMKELPVPTPEEIRDFAEALADGREFSRVCDADCPRRKYPILPLEEKTPNAGVS